MVNYWPGVGVGLIVAAYWGRVLRLVYKSYKRTGRSANFWPAEPIGRVLRFIWIPAIVCWIVFPSMTGLLNRTPRALALLWFNLPLAAIAVLIALSALIATLVCWKKMGKSWRMGIDPNEKTQLIITGPYAYVRHPIYALSQVLMVASVIAVPSIAMCVVAAIHLLFLQWEARREERYLVRTHGSQYEQYLNEVGRFIPKLRRAMKTS